MCLSELLAGEIGFQVDGADVDEHTADFLNHTWRNFIRDMLRSHWCWGIIVVGFRPAVAPFHAVPVVVDLERVKVDIFRPVVGAALYRVMDPESMSPLHQRPVVSVDAHDLTNDIRMAAGHGSIDIRHGMLTPPLENLLVFETDPPAFSGKLRSKVMTLLPDIENMRNLGTMALDVIRFASRATVFADPVPAPGIAVDQLAMAAPAVPPVPSTFDKLDPVAMTPEQKAQAMRVAAQTQLVNAGLDPRLVLTNAAATRQTLGNVDVLKLPDGFKLSGQVQRTELRTVVEMQREFETLVSAFLLVPRSMYAQGDYTRSTNSSGSELTFTHAQQSMKTFFVPMLVTTFAHNYGFYYAENKAYERVSGITGPEEIENVLNSTALDVQILLSGLPPTEEMKDLYAMGILEYDALVEHLSKAYCLPKNHFVADPVITPAHLMGIQADETDVAVDTVDRATGANSTTRTKTVMRNRAAESSAKGRLQARASRPKRVSFENLTKRRKIGE